MNIILLANGELGKLFAIHIKKIVSISLFVSEDIYCDGLNNYQYSHVCDRKFEFLEGYNFDCIISYNWNRLITNDILNKYICYNFHPSILPRHRGPIPLVFSILQQETVIGMTMHKMDELFDTGDIYKQIEFSISTFESYTSIHLKCMRTAILLLKQFCAEFPNINHIPQKLLPNASYDWIKDLDNYIITNNTTLFQFDLTAHAFNKQIPFRVEYEGEIETIIDFSYEETDNSNIKYKLEDSYIYLDLNQFIYR